MNDFLTFRVLSDQEKSMLSTEAQGYMLNLRVHGLLSSEEFETIMEKIVSDYWSTLSVDDTKELLSEILLSLRVGKIAHFRNLHLNPLKN